MWFVPFSSVILIGLIGGGGAKMTKKDFELIASAVRESLKLANTPLERGAVAMTALQLALVCAKNNGCFDRAWFLSMCGFEGSA